MSTVYSGVMSNTQSTFAATWTGMADQIKNAIVANSSWTLVETISGSTFRQDVFKCASATSGLSADYYVNLQWPVATGGTMTIRLAEGYDATNHVLTKVAPLQTSTSYTPDSTLGTFPGTHTFTVSTGNMTSASGPGPDTLFAVTLSGTTSLGMVVAYDNHLVVGVARSTTTWQTAYVGAYDSASPNPAAYTPLPLCIYANLQCVAATSFGGSSTRDEHLKTAHAYCGSLAVASGSWPYMCEDYRAGQQLSTLASGEYFQYNGSVTASRIRVLVNASHPFQAHAVKGYLSGLVIPLAAPGTPNVGDTISLNGTKWVAVHSSVYSALGAIFVDTGVAG